MTRDEAVAMLDRFLALTAERKLDEAATYLADGAVLTFPPSLRFNSLQEMVANARTRYRWCDKVRGRWDVAEREDGSVVVYSLGTLFGDNVHGVHFEGIRYIDRFVLKDGKIIEQEVWNDLASSGVLNQQPTESVANEPAGIQSAS